MFKKNEIKTNNSELKDEDVKDILEMIEDLNKKIENLNETKSKTVKNETKEEVKVKFINDSDNTLMRGSELSSGYDLAASEDGVIPANSVVAIGTKIYLGYLTPGYEIQMRPRSGVSLKNDLSIPNAPGTIDADYRGEMKIIMRNHSQNSFKYTKGQRLAQLVFAKVEHPLIEFGETAEVTERGENGFGSTGE